MASVMASMRSTNFATAVFARPGKAPSETSERAASHIGTLRARAAVRISPTVLSPMPRAGRFTMRSNETSS